MDEVINKITNYEQIKLDLRPIFIRFNSLKAVYLFGSRVTGFCGIDSDLDIAMRFSHDMPPNDCFDSAMALSDPLEAHFGRTIDVVILNSASLKMIRQVLHHGILLYTVDPDKEMDYAVHKRKEYFDFQYFMDIDRRELKNFFVGI